MRPKENGRLFKEIVHVHVASFGVFGLRKVELQLNRKGISAGRYRFAPLMTRLGLEGVVGGKVVRTTMSDKAAARPFDLNNRRFHARR